MVWRGNSAATARALGLAYVVALNANVAFGAFTTVINSPPTSFDDLGYFRIGSNTQVNLFEGGVLSGYFNLGDVWRPSDNIEVNLDGGLIRDSLSTSGPWAANTNVVINIRRGTVGGSLAADNGNEINIFGGSTGPLYADESSRVNLVGGDFRLNGTPIAGLGAPGSDVQVDLRAPAVLTGVLEDGTPLLLTTDGIYGDQLADGSLHLVSAPIPAATPTIFYAAGGTAPRGLRAGQRLVVSAGGVAGANFRATSGSSVSIVGGEVGPRLRAAGAIVDVAGGRLGELATIGAGAVLNVSAGSVGSNMNAGYGSVVTIAGGHVEALFEALAGSEVHLSGGVVEPLFYAHEGSGVTIKGNGFRLNGIPVSGLGTVGATRRVDVPAGAVLSGTYADGRQFAFSDQIWDYIAPGTLALQAAPAAAPGPTVIHLPNDAAPRGLATGQSLFVSAGGVVGDDFNADWGSVLTMDGGRLGGGFEAVGALVNVMGGSIGWRFDALYGSVANISGGSLEGVVRAQRGSVLNFSGGEVGIYLTAGSGGTVNMSGGNAGEYATVNPGGVLNISGGRVGQGLRTDGGTLNLSGGQIGDEVAIWSDSQANLSGGTMGDELQVWGGSRILITGGDFRLNGTPIGGLPNYGASAAVEIPAGSVLSGTLEDGTPFAFSDSDGDHFEPGSVRLLQWPYSLPEAPKAALAGGEAPTGVRGGQSLTVDAGHSLGDNFGAGWGSAVTMVGGAVGDNFEAVGSQVLIAGGAVGEQFDAFYGSVVTVTGGSIGGGFTGA